MRVPRPRLPPGAARRTAEIAGGLLTANAGDALNTLMMSMFLAVLVERPYLLALLPVLAALRGSVMMSMASRLTSRLYLGLYAPRARALLREEAPRTVALALLSAGYAALLVAALSGESARLTVPTAVLSAVAALSVLLPLTVVIVVAGFRRSLDPDNYVAPILTVLGDVSTVPSLVLAALVVGRSDALDSLLAVASLYAALSLSFSLSLSSRADRRVIAESLLGLALVGLMESFTGGFIARYREELIAITVLHLVPSMMEDIGAALSVFSSRMTTLSHLQGFQGALRKSPIIMAEVLAASVPAMIVLSAIGYLTAGLAYTGATYTGILRVVVSAWFGLLGLLAPVALLIAWLSTRLGLDPDNVVLPLVTSLVDLSLVPFIVIVLA